MAGFGGRLCGGVMGLWVALAMLPAPARADEVREIRIAQQYGIPFLPLTIIKEQGLLEKAVAAAGLPRAASGR